MNYEISGPRLNLDVPLIEQLTFYPVPFTEICHDEVTPEVIRRRSAEVRATWDAQTERVRATGLSTIKRVEVQEASSSESNNRPSIHDY